MTKYMIDHVPNPTYGLDNYKVITVTRKGFGKGQWDRWDFYDDLDIALQIFGIKEKDLIAYEIKGRKGYLPIKNGLGYSKKVKLFKPYEDYIDMTGEKPITLDLMINYWEIKNAYFWHKV